MRFRHNKVNYEVMDEAYKKKLDIRKFKHNEDNFQVTHDGHPYFMNIFKCFDDY